ncbi:MAG: sulfite oxidase [Chloroflexota bacterium]|nr:sulfite oxidase [Chloroflexota bacterium]MDE2919115.1 sulfite oxidase [Chloroflexota bacterium]
MTDSHVSAVGAPGVATPEVSGLWRFAQRQGMDRRRFLQALTAGGAAAVLAACGERGEADSGAAAVDARSAATPAPSPAWFKDTTPFIVHDDGKSLEARLENMRGVITPVREFFVRNNSVSLDVDVESWQLSIEGDAVTNPIQLSYNDILKLPRRRIVSYLECAGNQRAMFDLVKGQKAKGTQWKTGGVGCAAWTGVSLRDVLQLAGISDDAANVLLIGLDTESPEEGFRRVLPAEKALHPDTLLAYRMNNERLPRDHGFPLRALVPGWVGSTNVKWLGRIVVSRYPIWTRNNTTSYVLIGDAYPSEGEAAGKVTTKQVIKSALALPWPAKLEAVSQRLHCTAYSPDSRGFVGSSVCVSEPPLIIRGVAHSPDGPIMRVEWSTDSGRTWRDATLSRYERYEWAWFTFDWDPVPGNYIVMTRATDAAGNTQPDEIPFNEKGYLFNQPLPHPVTVTPPRHAI